MLIVTWCVSDALPWRITENSASSIAVRILSAATKRLGQLGIEQKRGKLFAAETRRHIARAQILRNTAADLFQRVAAGQMSVSVIDVFKMVDVQHQYAELPFFGR